MAMHNFDDRKKCEFNVHIHFGSYMQTFIRSNISTVTDWSNPSMNLKVDNKNLTSKNKNLIQNNPI